MKSKVDKLYVDKLVPGPVKNDIVIKMYIMIRSKILKMKYLILLTLIPDTTLNAKTNEVKGETPSIINLATTTALTTVKKKKK